MDTARPFLGQCILEIGAGTGNMSRWLPNQRLILTEPDPKLLEVLRERFEPHRDTEALITRFDPLGGDVKAFDGMSVDTIVSFNVLEHIEDDVLALSTLAEILRRSNGAGVRRLLTFVPAHQWAYGTLDRSFGHCRRYSWDMMQGLLRRVAPEADVSLRYFNACGLAAWLLSGRVLRRPQLSIRAIRTSESLMPVLRRVDERLRSLVDVPFGQSLLSVAIWPPR
jgi:SAM-dependent methyltransferase